MTPIKGATIIFVVGILVASIIEGSRYTEVDFDLGDYGEQQEVVAVTADTSSDRQYNVSFKDVQPGDWYYADVMSAASNGYVNGYEDGEFKPDKPVTLKELVTMLGRQSKFDGYILRSYGESMYLLFAKQQGWVPSELYHKGALTREEALHIILAGTNIASWVDEDIDFNDASEIDEDYARDFCAGTGLGIINGNNGNLQPKEIATRAEVCTMMNRALNCLCDVYAPDDLMELNIEYSGDNTSWLSWAFREAVGNLPKEVLKEYISRGWTLVFTDDLDRYYYEFETAVGLTNYSKESIYVEVGPNLNMKSVTTVYHEFGHFVMWTMGENFRNRVVEAKNEEQATLAKALNRNYCRVNEREYFAEAFRYYITNEGDLDTEDLAMTYEMISSAVNAVAQGYQTENIAA